MFTAREYDSETGNYYYRARYYSPTIGRFLQSDPIGYKGGLNLYAYCGNNPIIFTDPYGLFRFGKRPFKGKPWLGPFSSNPIDDYFNTEASHEQGFFEDGSGDNVGFFDDNTIKSEDPTGRGYRYDDKHYDDDLMREALKNVPKGDYSLLGWGKKEKNNCQDWAERLRGEYHRLEKERNTKNSGINLSNTKPSNSGISSSYTNYPGQYGINSSYTGYSGQYNGASLSSSTNQYGRYSSSRK